MELSLPGLHLTFRSKSLLYIQNNQESRKTMDKIFTMYIVCNVFVAIYIEFYCCIIWALFCFLYLLHAFQPIDLFFLLYVFYCMIVEAAGVLAQELCYYRKCYSVYMTIIKKNLKKSSNLRLGIRYTKVKLIKFSSFLYCTLLRLSTSACWCCSVALLFPLSSLSPTVRLYSVSYCIQVKMCMWMEKKHLDTPVSDSEFSNKWTESKDQCRKHSAGSFSFFNHCWRHCRRLHFRSYQLSPINANSVSNLMAGQNCSCIKVPKIVCEGRTSTLLYLCTTAIGVFL